MDRREFLKTLLAGAACASVPCFAVEPLLKSGQLSGFGLLYVDYSWLGTGRLKVSHYAGTSKVTKLSIYENDKLLDVSYLLDGSCSEVPLVNIDINSIRLIIEPDGKEPREIRLSEHSMRYAPGESRSYLIDLEHEMYSFLGKGPITFDVLVDGQFVNVSKS